MNKRMKLAMTVLVIALAVTIAAFVMLSGAGNGYEAVFKAFEKLVFEQDNYTFDHSTFVRTDGAILYRTGGHSEKDGPDTHGYITDESGEKTNEHYTLSAREYRNVDHENKTYYTYNYYSSADDPFSKDTKEARTVARLIKLYADFVTGSAKNQFMHKRTDGGHLYTLSLTNEQLPEVVLLLSELAGSLADFSYEEKLTVEYEDRFETFSAIYRQRTGEELSEHFMSTWDLPDELRSAYNAFTQEIEDRYTSLGEELSPTAYVHVYADGTYEMAESKKAFLQMKAADGYDNIDLLEFMNGFSVGNVSGSFLLNKEGLPVKASMSVTIDVIDLIDTIHPVELVFDASFTDYDATKIDAPDFTAYTNLNTIKTSRTYVETTETIRFLGQDYTYTYEKEVEEVIE